MRKLATPGMGMVLMGLLLMLLTLNVNHYRLSDETVEAVVSDSAHFAALQPALKGMIGKTYKSKFSFVSDLHAVAEKTNDELEKKEVDAIETDYTLPLLVNSVDGPYSNHEGLLLAIILFLYSAGGIMFFSARYLTKPPGIKNDHVFHKKISTVGWDALLLGIGLIVFYILLYWWPWMLADWISFTNPLSHYLNKGDADEYFLYGLVYTVVVLLLGIKMIMKYRHSRYQQIRSMSVMFFQASFAFLVPEILKSLNQPSVDLKNIWPLDYTFFYDSNIKELISSGKFGIFVLGWGIALIIIAVPLFTYFFGKRWYCSWVCGCGGLAETAGDPFRHLSSKKLIAWKIERIIINAVLVITVLMTAIMFINYFSGGKLLNQTTDVFQQWYGFAIGSVFAGVIGTGLYPILGSRVWCRFGCPLAAIFGIIQRYRSRFRITTNGGQCISCGHCSTYCEMGIDVRAYAQRGQNIVRSSCVGCGICAEVCPRGVLKLENGSDKGRITNDPIMIGNDGIRVNL